MNFDSLQIGQIIPLICGATVQIARFDRGARRLWAIVVDDGGADNREAFWQLRDCAEAWVWQEDGEFVGHSEWIGMRIDWDQMRAASLASSSLFRELQRIKELSRGGI